LLQCGVTGTEADRICHRTKPEIKRQRTGSRSPSGSPVLESEDDSTRASAPRQKPRGAAARSQHQKELREKDKEKERTEAASRRKGRAERRKVDGMLFTLLHFRRKLTPRRRRAYHASSRLRARTSRHTNIRAEARTSSTERRSSTTEGKGEVGTEPVLARYCASHQRHLTCARNAKFSTGYKRREQRAR
jgi:hypothetical protein